MKTRLMKGGYSDARALVDELEFVWDQIKNNSASSSNSSPGRRGVPSYNSQPRQFQQPLSGNDGPMRVLSPMSQDDEAERESERRIGYDENYGEDDDYNEGGKKDRKTGRWRKTVEQALVRMTAEIAALREQIATGREYQGRRARSFGAWVAWLLWLAIRHLLVDMVVLGIVLLWLRRKKDRRIEDLVREGLRIGREYIRRILPAR
jgi:hypothetical protein